MDDDSLLVVEQSGISTIIFIFSYGHSQNNSEFLCIQIILSTKLRKYSDADVHTHHLTHSISFPCLAFAQAVLFFLMEQYS